MNALRSCIGHAAAVLQRHRAIAAFDDGDGHGAGFDRLRRQNCLLQSLGVVFRDIPGGIAGLDILRDREPGCVLIDMDAAGAAVAGLGDLPIGRVVMPVVVMSAHAEVAVVVDAMRLGACDFLTKPLDREVVAASLVRVFDRLGGARETYWRRQQARARIEALSDREHDILRGLLAGRANKALAFALGTRLMTKLGVQSLAQAIRMAFDAGIDLDTRGDPVKAGNANNAAPDEQRPPVATIAAERCYG